MAKSNKNMFKNNYTYKIDMQSWFAYVIQTDSEVKLFFIMKLYNYGYPLYASDKLDNRYIQYSVY